MTENDKNNLLCTNYLNISETLTSDTLTTLPQLDNTLFIGSNMTIGTPCLYTTLPAELANNYPEGTVLQILSEAPVISTAAVTSTSSATVSNLTSFPSALLSEQSSSLPSLLVSSNHCETQDLTEGNISDIDLSFLNDTEESASTSKNFNEAEVRELHSMIDIVEPSSLGIIQNNHSNIINNGYEQAEPTNPKPSEGAGDVVVIDVSNPIQLSQNALIKVNGQKCILQQDPKTGQVLAYPVKDPDKPKRKPGRKRKSSIEQTDRDTSLDSGSTTVVEHSDEEQEKGLLEVVNDDGSLVRRSSRKRKKAKILKDYETGNLKQELGSDVEESSFNDDSELQFPRRKCKGLGRPRKQTSQQTLTMSSNASVDKRPRGRPPKKQTLEKEPTQAFLVETADGQSLMMHLPLSSIPAGVTLQEVAQNIANRLNSGLSMASVNETANSKTVNSNHLLSAECENVTEPVVQDLSVGSTSNFPPSEPSMEERGNSDRDENSCSNIISQIEESIVCSPRDSTVINEVVLNGDKSNNFLPESLFNKHSLSIDAKQSKNAFSTSIPSSTFTSSSTLSKFTNSETLSLNSSSSILSSLPSEVIVDQKTEHDIVGDLNSEHFSKDFLLDGDFLKDKVNLHYLLQNVTESVPTLKSQTVKGTVNHDELSIDPMQTLVPTSSLSVSVEKDNTFSTKSFDCDKNLSMGAQNHKLTSCDSLNSNYDLNNDEVMRKHAILTSIEHDHDFLFQTKSPPLSVNLTSSDTELNLIENGVSSKSEHYQQILPLENTSSIFKVPATSENSVVQQALSTIVIPVTGEENEQEVILPNLEGTKKCKICHKFFNSEDEIISHFKSDHPKCICKVCNYMAEHGYIVTRHALRHMNAGCVCKLCGKRYKDHYILKMHIKTVHLPAETIYTCEICEKSFTRKAHLKRHLRIHEPDRPYKCSFCEYRGCERSDITKHLLVHQTPKHKCHLCGKTFRHIKNVELHIKRHYKQRDYKCGICDFYGYTFTDIRKHIERRHAGLSSSNLVQVCSDCGLMFSSEMLEAHKSNGECLVPVIGQDLSAKEVIVSTDVQKLSNATSIEGIPLNILESENSGDNNSIKTELSEIKLDASSVILNPINDSSQTEQQLIISGFETLDLISSDSLSLIPIDKDPGKLVTLVTANGKTFSYVKKDSSNLFDVLSSANINSNEPTIFLSDIETEVCT